MNKHTTPTTTHVLDIRREPRVFCVVCECAWSSRAAASQMACVPPVPRRERLRLVRPEAA